MEKTAKCPEPIRATDSGELEGLVEWCDYIYQAVRKQLQDKEKEHCVFPKPFQKNQAEEPEVIELCQFRGYKCLAEVRYGRIVRVIVSQ